ncbi:hypothetical protein PAXRUDRAFT_830946 [Paxillus rubicundulus Ve08.2h10]|uniref:Uncharacterized protein n=1 Tax=Paxillus rubicundulus Ve08.2h10 TaxID=930991 RepID=A0A0D0DST4_9AGAM|nr:hypothetical protein PAXRUDRAFT_830946 [Paxillus rubicundulus Ve08.2h10]
MKYNRAKDCLESAIGFALHQRQRPFTLTPDDSLAMQCRGVIGRHTDEKGRSLSYTKRVCSMSAQ